MTPTLEKLVKAFDETLTMGQKQVLIDLIKQHAVEVTRLQMTLQAVQNCLPDLRVTVAALRHDLHATRLERDELKRRLE